MNKFEDEDFDFAEYERNIQASSAKSGTDVETRQGGSAG